jgi:hypothetical protein
MFRYWGSDHIDLVAWKVNCKPSDVAGDSHDGNWDPTDLLPQQKQYYASCKGNAAVYRISLMTAAFFFLMAAGSAVSKAAHTGFWAPKMLLYTALIVAGFFLPNYVFDDSGYAWISRVSSFLFLLAQITILVDFGYKWNDSWVKNAQKEEAEGHAGSCQGCCGGWFGNGSRYYGGILASCGIFYVFWLVGISLMFKYYTCSTSQAFIAITLILVLIMTALQLATPDAGALLPSAVVTAYCTYLCWSAVANNPDPQCFPDSGIGSHNDNPGLMFVVSICSADACSTDQHFPTPVPPCPAPCPGPARLFELRSPLFSQACSVSCRSCPLLYSPATTPPFLSLGRAFS